MEVITSVNDGKETEYGLILNQSELDTLVHLLGSMTRNLEREIGYLPDITRDMYKALRAYENEEIESVFSTLTIKAK